MADLIQEQGIGSDFGFDASENGFDPEDALVPVAPAFPHPVPQFILDQLEDRNKIMSEALEDSEDGEYI